MCTIHITSSIDDLNKLFNPNYHLLVTYGDAEKEYHSDILSNSINRFGDRWIHKTHESIKNIEEFNRNVNYCYIHNVISKRHLQRPKFSIFTTCYNTWEKFDRVYNSLLSQKLKDWEWVILDDTPQNKTKNHFDFLKEKCKNENRIRLYCRSENSGNIGNVKNEAVSLCRGKYLLELDHDDEILPDCLLDATEVFEKNDDVGFIYMDFANIYENGDNFKYSDFMCKGYGGYYCQKYNDKWVNVYITPNINNITLSALVCCPNHPRIWRRSVLQELENYSEFLPICDDYEILLKTAINTKIVKINKLGYIQYMNDNNNNFSLIRNSEINRIGPHHIFPQFYDMYNVNEKMKKLSAHEDEHYINNHSQIWKRENYTHNYCNKLINLDYDKQYCIINDNIEHPDLIELYKNPKNDFIFLSNKLSHDEIFAKLDEKGFDRMKCYSMLDASEKELEKYFKFLYANSNCQHEILDNKSNAIEALRINIIRNIPNINMNPLAYIFENMKLKPKSNTLWLEFGVLTGNTINYISKFTNDIVYGFDSFEGLPEEWRVGFPKGWFNKNGNLPDVNNNVTLIKGWFNETVEDFIKVQDKKISFIHMDADLYSSTKYVLDTLKNHIDNECIIVFDELVNYDGYAGERGELKAFYEFIIENNVDYEWIGMNGKPIDKHLNHNQQVGLIIHSINNISNAIEDLSLIETNIYDLDTGNLKEQFQNKNPYNHIVLDNTINDEFLKKMENEIRNLHISEIISENVYGIDNVQENKFSCRDFTKFNYANQAKDYFESDKFLKWLSIITGIENLQKDEYNHGNGIHIIKENGKLNIHADFNRHSESKKYRRLNLLLYLNSNYDEKFNGKLELWNKEMTKCEKSIEPIFNRIIIFQIDDDANHGHPELWKSSSSDRISLALYYYTDDRPEHEKSERSCALWKTPIIKPIN